MSEWKKVKLGEIAITIQTGPFGSQLHQSDYSEFGTPVVMPKDIVNGKIDVSTIARVESYHIERLSRYKITEGDILYARRGDVGKCVYIEDYQEGWLCGTGCLRVKIDITKALPKFVFFQLQKKEIIGWIEKHAIGATMLNLNTSILSNVPIDLPPIETQNRIATILSRYDSLIENYQKQIKLLEESAQRLYKEWFIDFRFSGHENTKIVDGIPEGWKELKITDNQFFRPAQCRIIPFEGIKNYYATADVNGTYICSSGVVVGYDDKPSRAQIQPSQHSVWFARMSNSYKIIGFTRTNEERRKSLILSSGFAGFESAYECFSYMYCLVSSTWFDEQKNRYATGATQVSLTNEGLSRIKVVFPTQKLVKEFSLKINPIIDNVFLLRECCFELVEARNRLLLKLMNGEIEV